MPAQLQQTDPTQLSNYQAAEYHFNCAMSERPPSSDGGVTSKGAAGREGRVHSADHLPFCQLQLTPCNACTMRQDLSMSRDIIMAGSCPKAYSLMMLLAQSDVVQLSVWSVTIRSVSLSGSLSVAVKCAVHREREREET